MEDKYSWEWIKLSRSATLLPAAATSDAIVAAGNLIAVRPLLIAIPVTYLNFLLPALPTGCPPLPARWPSSPPVQSSITLIRPSPLGPSLSKAAGIGGGGSGAQGSWRWRLEERTPE